MVFIEREKAKEILFEYIENDFVKISLSCDDLIWINIFC